MHVSTCAEGGGGPLRKSGRIQTTTQSGQEVVGFVVTVRVGEGLARNAITRGPAIKF